MNKDCPGFLDELGWDSFFVKEFDRLGLKQILPARVISQDRNSYTVMGEHGEIRANLSGRLRYQTAAGFYPVIGDWAAVASRPSERQGVIQAVLTRKSSFSRKIAGGPTEEQVVAANVDTVFLVSGLDGGRNFNPRSIERYLTVAWSSGARPVIVLNKADVCPDVAAFVARAELVAAGVPVHAVSAVAGSGLESLKTYVAPGQTIALLGHSGVGKSAIINAWLGEERQQVGAVRAGDRRGRHTTTRRELFLLPGGGSVIDTPGMREIQVWGGESSLGDTFDDIERLAENCRFTDCHHESEPGCAVRQAIRRGVIDDARFQNYLKLQKELRYLVARREGRVRLEEKERWKKLTQWAKQMKKNR